MQAIHRRFGLPPSLPDRIANAIKAADRIAAYYEATGLAGFTLAEANRYFGVPRGVPDALRASPGGDCGQTHRLRPEGVFAALSGTVTGIACQKLGEAEGQ